MDAAADTCTTNDSLTDGPPRIDWAVISISVAPDAPGDLTRISVPSSTQALAIVGREDDTEYSSRESALARETDSIVTKSCGWTMLSAFRFHSGKSAKSLFS